MIKILLATANAHKAAELEKILPRAAKSGVRIQYFSLADFNIVPPKEDGATLEENALIKARAGMLASGLVSVADDTGIMVDALNGAPGVLSGRYAYPDKTDYRANNEKLLKELQGVEPSKRSARFVTVAAVAFPDGRTFTTRGSVEGRIAQNFSGKNGFGYDPLFIVGSLGVSMADLSMEQKNKISHRAKAFAQMAEIIGNL